MKAEKIAHVTSKTKILFSYPVNFASYCEDNDDDDNDLISMYWYQQKATSEKCSPSFPTTSHYFFYFILFLLSTGSLTFLLAEIAGVWKHLSLSNTLYTLFGLYIHESS